MIGTSTSLLWDNSTKLLEITRLILDPKALWLHHFSEEDIEIMAPLIWGAAPTEKQKELVAYKIAQAKAHQDTQEEPVKEESFPSGTPEELFQSFRQQISNWLNREEVNFIQTSWEARTSRIQELIRQRDEALAAALSAKARQIYPEDNTTALNLAMAAYQLAQTEESSAAIMDITSDSNSAFYQNLPAHTETVMAVAFSPDGQLFISGSRDNSAILWDLKGNQVARFIGHSNDILALTFTPDGKHVLTASADKTVRLWDLEGEELRQYNGSNAGIASIAISPNGEIIAGGLWNSKIILWDFSGRELRQYLAHTGNGGIARVISLTFSPDGQKLLSGSFDGTAKLWDLQGNRLATFELGNEHSDVKDVAFSPDGTKVLTGHFTPKLWDLQGNNLVVFQGHEKSVVATYFFPDGQQILTVSQDNTVRLWDLSGKEIRRYGVHAKYLNCASLSPNGNWLVTGGGDWMVPTGKPKEKTIQLWNMTGRTILQIEGLEYAASKVTFSPDGQKIMASFPTPPVKQWDLQGKELQTTNLEGFFSVLTFSRDGQKILVGHRNAPAKLWDMAGNELAQFEGHNTDVTAVALSPNNDRILTGANDGKAKLWDSNGNELQTIELITDGFSTNAASMAFSPDGETLLISTSRRLKQQLKLWDLEGNELTYFEGHRDYVTAITFAPDGKQILAGDADAIIKLWDLKGKEIMAFRGHTDEINNLVFSSGGKYFISTAFEETKLWDLNGHQIGRIDRHTFTSVAFSPDSQLLLTAGNDRTIRLWRNILGEWAHGKIYRLNPDERLKYKIDWAY